jgi:hypothetical protein
MDRLAEIGQALDELGPRDFDDANENTNGMDRVYLVCDELSQRDDPERWMPLLFSLMERLGDLDLGSPGPIVHTLEQTGAAYRPLLAESVRRAPTPLTVWMVNRVLNENPDDRDFWIELLSGVERTSGASQEAVDEARNFLAYQRSR